MRVEVSISVACYKKMRLVKILNFDAVSLIIV